jgi:hypothetical protein
VVQLYSVRHSGDMARIRDTAPVICRGFVIFEVRHAKRTAPPCHAPARLGSVGAGMDEILSSSVSICRETGSTPVIGNSQPKFPKGSEAEIQTETLPQSTG